MLADSVQGTLRTVNRLCLSVGREPLPSITGLQTLVPLPGRSPCDQQSLFSSQNTRNAWASTCPSLPVAHALRKGVLKAILCQALGHGSGSGGRALFSGRPHCQCVLARISCQAPLASRGQPLNWASSSESRGPECHLPDSFLSSSGMVF